MGVVTTLVGGEVGFVEEAIVALDGMVLLLLLLAFFWLASSLFFLRNKSFLVTSSSNESNELLRSSGRLMFWMIDRVYCQSHGGCRNVEARKNGANGDRQALANDLLRLI